MNKPLRRLSFALQTFLGIARRGYFIPYRYADEVPALGSVARYEALASLFEAARPTMDQTLGWVSDAEEGIRAIKPGAAPPEPRWRQSWFPRLDAAIAYAIVRKVQPMRLIEIGSGHSTRFYVRAAKDGQFPIELLAIDPAPRADILKLGIKTIREPVQNVDLSLFQALQPGDVLSIDSSHILMPGSDVDYLLNRVLPKIPIGVYLHIHDIFLPEDYPQTWSWRAYNEQQGVAPFLHAGGYKILWSSQYMLSVAANEIDASPVGQIERLDEAFETSLWLLRI